MQLMELSEPTSPTNFATGHDTHAVDPKATWYLPTVQKLHVAAPMMDENCPGAQSSQSDERDEPIRSSDEPAAHFTQLVETATDWYCP